jgi:RNA polymerase sigma-70 factor (ECF subfamily)
MRHIAAGQGTPLDQVLRTELEEQIAGAMAELPFEQRLVFLMKTSEEMSYQEISESLDISPGTVMSRLSRARSKLKELLQPYMTFFESEEKQ